MRRSTYLLIQPFILLNIIMIIGAFGYMFLEGSSFMDSLYMTVITITTVGYAEVVPLQSDVSRLFTMFLLLTSWSAFALAIARITQFVVSGEINQYFKTRKIMKDISRLRNHVIICGYGRNGHQAGRTLASHRVPFVVIEKDASLLQKIESEGEQVLHLMGDSTEDELLRQAGIEHAQALITTLPVDAQNVFIVLSARALNPAIQIISRASEASSVSKLKKAGADNVIMPDHIGGNHMATLVSKPDVVEFIDYLSGDEGNAILIESVSCEVLPVHLKGKTLVEVMNWNRTGVNCIGIKDNEGRFVINPPESTLVSEGMKVIVLGTQEQISQMKQNLRD